MQAVPALVAPPRPPTPPRPTPPTQISRLREEIEEIKTQIGLEKTKWVPCRPRTRLLGGVGLLA